VRLAVGFALAAVTVGPHGIGTVRFGEPQRVAVAGLRVLFGAPTRHLPNPGCGSRFREVEWRHLYAEFRSGRFEGFRYLLGGWSINRAPGAPPPADTVVPKLVTAKGIMLGDTLSRVRAAYGLLRPVGTDRWESPDGLVFYDNAKHDPESPSSRIVEIKIGTCGDF